MLLSKTGLFLITTMIGYLKTALLSVFSGNDWAKQVCHAWLQPSWSDLQRKSRMEDGWERDKRV